MHADVLPCSHTLTLTQPNVQKDQSVKFSFTLPSYYVRTLCSLRRSGEFVSDAPLICDFFGQWCKYVPS